jgi:hypothetical protein
MREFILQHADMLEYIAILVIGTGCALFVAMTMLACSEAKR